MRRFGDGVVSQNRNAYRAVDESRRMVSGMSVPEFEVPQCASLACLCIIKPILVWEARSGEGPRSSRVPVLKKMKRAPHGSGRIERRIEEISNVNKKNEIYRKSIGENCLRVSGIVNRVEWRPGPYTRRSQRSSGGGIPGRVKKSAACSAVGIQVTCRVTPCNFVIA